MPKPRKDSDTLRIGSTVKIVSGPNPWREGIYLQVAKRKWRGSPSFGNWRYFIVGEDSPAGAGCWIESNRLRPVSPLEELGRQADSD